MQSTDNQKWISEKCQNHYLVDFLDKKKQQAVAHPVYYTKIHYTTLHHTLLHYFTTLHNYRIHTRHPTLSCRDTSCFFRTVLVNTLLSQLSHQFVMFGWYVFIDNGFSVNFIITMVIDFSCLNTLFLLRTVLVRTE